MAATARAVTATAPTVRTCVLAVPDGTVVTDEHGEVIADLVGAGTELVVAEGGRGGLGNAALASRQAQGAGLRAARRAGRGAHDPPRAEGGRRRRSRRVSRAPASPA